MPRKLKFIATLFAVTAAIGTALSASAQSYPSKSVRVIIGYAPGGVTDVLNRIVADEIGKRLGQPFVVENRPGAAGLVAATAVKNAPADGYTLFGGSAIGFNPIFMKASMDASKELTPISAYATGDWFLYVPTSLGINNLKDLAAYGKANSGRVRFSSPATGNTQLFAMISHALGFKFENVPYRTTDQTIAALLSGDGHATFNAAPGFDPHIQSGKLKPISTLSPGRSPVRPDVPTAKEQGVDVVVRFNIGLWAPAGLPNDIVGKLGATVREALVTPSVAEKFRNAALTPQPSPPADMLREYASEIAAYKAAMTVTGYEPQ